MSYKLKEGLNFCTNGEYHGDKSYFSSSTLKVLLKDAQKFKEENIDLIPKPQVQKNAFDEGNYAHSLILEPENIPDEYAFFDGFTKRGLAWNAFKEEHADSGKIMLSKPQKHRVEKWYESFKKLPAAVELVKGGHAEYSLAGILEGMPIKVRADYINIEKGYVADVKTTAYDTDVSSFKQVIENLSYNLSGALYCTMFEQFYGKPFDFYFIVLGKNDGMCEVYKMSKDTMMKGKLLVSKAIRKYHKCMETNIWTEEKKNVIVNNTNYEILEI